MTTRAADLLDLEYKDIQSRGLTKETCARYGYGCATHHGQRVQVADYRRKGTVVSQHTRTKDKDFSWINQNPGIEFFGQHLWESGGKQLIITEGEIDCLVWAQTRNLKWPVVGCPGVSSIKMFKLHLEWLSSFEEILLYFDMDEPGQSFANEVAALLPPGKVRIGSTAPFKDSDEMARVAGSTDLFKTMYQAKTWRPAELTSAFDVLDERPSSVLFHYQWPELDEMSGGIRGEDLGLICAGTNVGKSFVAKNLAFQFLKQGLRVGFIALEESSRAVLEMLIGFEYNKTQSEVAAMDLETQRSYLSDCPWANSITFFTDRGEDLSEVILPRVNYMAQGEDCDIIFIDHISKVFSQFQKDQRKQIDEFMYALQSMCKLTSTPVLAVAHLRDPSFGPSHNDGAKPSLAELNGSSSLSRVPDVVWGVRRDVNNLAKRHLTELICLKSRWAGMYVGNSVWLETRDGPLLQLTDAPAADDDNTYFNDSGDF